MPTYKNLLIHTLAFGAGTPTTRQLDNIAARAAALGASGLELLFHPMPVLPAKQVGKVFKRHGLKRASLCVFYPGDLTLGDPTDRAWHPLTLKHAKNAANYVHRLLDENIDIEVVDGPLCKVLGRPQEAYGRHSFEAATEFATELGKLGANEGVTFCEEVLQFSEDGLVQTSRRCNTLSKHASSSEFKSHVDTFHFVKNGEKLGHVFRRLGQNIGHLHFNGIGRNRATEGRIPCGCRNFEIGGKLYTDTINWRNVRQQLLASGADLNKVLICLEPFHEDACAAIPPLREGVVPVTNDSQIAESVRNLAATGHLLVE